MKIKVKELGILVILFFILIYNPHMAKAFPKPTGEFSVGRTSLYWIDYTRLEQFSGKPEQKRKLMATIWYPTNDMDTPRVEYMPELERKSFVSSPTKTDVSKAWLNILKTRANSIEAANVAYNSKPYPVLIFSPGYGMTRYLYSSFMEELASHGYVVISLDHPYNQSDYVVFPDGKVANLKILNSNNKDVMDNFNNVFQTSAKDIILAINQLSQLNNNPQNIFYKKLDLNQIGVFGHSIGGGATAEAACQDPRIKAVMVLDYSLFGTVLEKGLSVPAVWLLSKDVYEYSIVFDENKLRHLYKNRTKPELLEKTVKNARMGAEQIKKSSLTGGATIVIDGMKNLDFSDLPLFTESTKIFGSYDFGKIKASRSNKIINAYLLAFFDTHLKGQNNVLLKGSSQEYPEANFIKY